MSETLFLLFNTLPPKIKPIFFVMQEEVLRQVQETMLFKHVVTFLSSVNSCCRSMSVLVHKNELPDIAEKVCCQGARILAGKFDSSERFYCRETCVKCLKANSDKPVTLVSGTVVNGSIEQEVDILVPSSQIGGCGCGPSNCIGIYPAGNDILTVLILALPKETWSGIRDEKLSRQILGLVTTENLPTLLQEEVNILSFWKKKKKILYSFAFQMLTLDILLVVL